MRKIAHGIFNGALEHSSEEIWSNCNSACDRFVCAYAEYPVFAGFSMLRTKQKSGYCPFTFVRPLSVKRSSRLL